MGRFIEILQKIVLERLNFITGYDYKQQIEIVVNQSGTTEEIIAAEKVVMALMKNWGEVIIGGDLLTVERFDQNMSLRSSNLTAFSKGSSLGPSRIAVFHFRQNILLKIIAAMIPNLYDSSNPGSLNSFRALTDKAKDISNQERKIKDNFELHYQYLMCIAEVYLEEKIVSYLKKKFPLQNDAKIKDLVKNIGDDELNSVLTELIEDSLQTIFFQKNQTLEKFKKSVDGDDLQEAGNLFVSVWFLFKSLEFITKTGDPDGIEYFKKNAVLLLLPLHSSASKYVHKGFHELVKMKSMSEQLKLRFNSGSFVKFHQERATSSNSMKLSDLNNRGEDMVCEWLVGDVKSSLKRMGGSYTEDLLEKKGPGRSWDRFDDEEINRFRQYVQKIDPFRYLYIGNVLF